MPQKPMTCPSDSDATPNEPRGNTGNQHTKKSIDIDWNKWMFFATATAAIAALWLLHLQRQTLIANQRAWVLFDKMNKYEIGEDGSWLVSLDIANVGNGPALSVSIYTTPLNALPEAIAINPNVCQPSVIILGPRQATSHETRIPSKFVLDDKSAYIYGLILYGDQFGTKHQTKLCLEVLQMNDGRLTGHHCPRFNAAD